MFPHDYRVKTSKMKELQCQVAQLRDSIAETRDDYVAAEIAAGGAPGPFASALDMALSQLVHVDFGVLEVDEYRASEK